MNQTMNEYADRIEACCPKGLRAGIGGSFLSHLRDLVAALRAGNIENVGRAVRDILNDLLPDPGPPKADALAAGFDWAKLKDILKSLIPFIIDLF